MSNKFASALKPKSQPALEAVETLSDEAKPASPHARPSRKSTKHVGGYFDPAVSKQLREIALTEDSSVQALLARHPAEIQGRLRFKRVLGTVFCRNRETRHRGFSAVPFVLP